MVLERKKQTKKHMFLEHNTLDKIREIGGPVAVIAVCASGAGHITRPGPITPTNGSEETRGHLSNVETGLRYWASSWTGDFNFLWSSK